jgi:hypothetical protein
MMEPLNTQRAAEVPPPESGAATLPHFPVTTSSLRPPRGLHAAEPLARKNRALVRGVTLFVTLVPIALLVVAFQQRYTGIYFRPHGGSVIDEPTAIWSSLAIVAVVGTVRVWLSLNLTRALGLFREGVALTGQIASVKLSPFGARLRVNFHDASGRAWVVTADTVARADGRDLPADRRLVVLFRESTPGVAAIYSASTGLAAGRVTAASPSPSPSAG